METERPQSDLAHILFIDAVGYSKMPLEQQAIVFRRLQDFVSDCPTAADAAAAGELVRSPSGDGMALVFFGDCTHPVHCASELAERIDADGSFAVRMGLHSGKVVKQLDVNGLTCASGDGVNIAQRVMDFGDGGHILMSLEYAKALQAAGDAAADDCHDIGIAAAKHGRRIHLFNYHRPAIGTQDVPVKVRKDDDWIRPKQLRLGTAGRNVIVATLQLLGWLLVAPNKWRTHVTQIDPRLSPNFSVIDLTGAQVRRNRDLRQLLLQVYLLCPAMLGLLVFALLAPLRHRMQIPPVAFIGMMLGMGWLATILLGIGAGFVGFLILAFQAVVQGGAYALFGTTRLATMLAVSAVCTWAYIALAAVFPVDVRRAVWRQVLAAICGAFASLMVIITAALLSLKRPPIVETIVSAAVVFVLITVIVGVRWRRWSRGFMFGQILSVLAAAMWLGSTAAGTASGWHAAVDGLTSGMMSCVYWALAFTVAERIGDARAAIVAGLLITVTLNATGVLSLVPLLIIWIVYAIMRRRSAARQPA